MWLVGFNKRFLAATVGAPGTHDARLLKHTGVFKNIQSGVCLPDKCIPLRNGLGQVLSVTIGDTTRDPKEKLYNQKLHSSMVDTENCYGMLKEDGG